MSEEITPDVLDEVAEDLKVHTGGRNLRREASALRGAYLTKWMDLELNLDELIAEYLEIPDSKRGAMTDGLLPLVASARAKVEFLNIVVKRVDPDSNAYRLTRKAQETRNALAHRPANFATISDEVVAGAIPFFVYKHGVRQPAYLTANDALALVESANEAIFNLTMKARPDYLERMRKRTLTILDHSDDEAPPKL